MVISDELFGLVYPDETASYFMLEVDRGTMPVVRRGKDRTSFARKIALYLDIWKGKVHTRAVRLSGDAGAHSHTVAQARRNDGRGGA